MDAKPDEQGILQWSNVNQVPEHLKKYWAQRFKIWEHYNDGIWMTEDSWFGVTPEPIANKIAAHIAESAPPNKTFIVDAFAGVGGNAIALARSKRWERVFAIEKDPKTLKCAKHNAEIYGVSGQIVWILGDCFEEIVERFSDRNNVVIFASPPWGGTEYSSEDVFDLTKMEPYNLEKLYKSFSAISKELVLYLPRTSDLNQIAKYVPKEKKLEVAHYAVMGASKALCVYFGDFNFEIESEATESQNNGTNPTSEAMSLD